MAKKKIRILFDAQPMAIGQKSGVGYYTTGLVQALAKIDPDSIELGKKQAALFTWEKTAQETLRVLREAA